MKDKHIGLRIPVALHAKLKHVSKYEGRSMNKQILYLIRKNVQEFEDREGKIEIDDKK